MVTPDLNMAPTDETTYCAVHPDRETTLRCNKCERYMCVDCAVQTPVGYRCKECVRGIQDKYYKASNNDYVILAAVCLALGGAAGAILQSINIGILFSLILGLPVGGGIAEVALRAIQRRRGRQSAIVAAAAAVIGGLVGAGVAGYLTFMNNYNQALQQLQVRGGGDVFVTSPSLNDILMYAFGDLSLLLFIGLVAFAVYGRFKMRG